MAYVLHSTEVQLRTRTVMVPPISMYHLRKLLELRDTGVDLDKPNADGIGKIIALLAEVIAENHPEVTEDVLAKELDANNMPIVLSAIQSLPKNSTAQTGMTTPVVSPPTPVNEVKN